MADVGKGPEETPDAPLILCRTRVAFGFKSPDALIALAMLNLGGHRPALPGRR